MRTLQDDALVQKVSPRQQAPSHVPHQCLGSVKPGHSNRQRLKWHKDAGVRTCLCGQHHSNRGRSLHTDMPAACCGAAAARQPDQAAARRLERPLFTAPEDQRKSLDRNAQPKPCCTAQPDELKDLGSCGWASEHDVVTVGSWRPPSSGVRHPHMQECDSIELVDGSTSKSDSRRTSFDNADEAALSPPTPSPRASA